MMNMESELNFIHKRQYFISLKTNNIYEDFDFDPVPIDQGNFGVVYKATDKNTEEIITIKQINLKDSKGGT